MSSGLHRKKLSPFIAPPPPTAPGLKPSHPITPKHTTAAPPVLCTCCNKPTTQTFTPNQCTRCKATTYCSRRCQVSDWPFHKRICNKPISSATSIPAPPNLIIKPVCRKHTQQSDGADPRIMADSIHWLAGLPESTCYHIIIDTYRLRLDAEWGDVDRFCRGDYEALLTHFHEFLEGARAVGALPGWWGEGNMVACMRIAINHATDACILRTTKELKTVVAKKYEDAQVPRKLLSVAERVYGWCEAY